MTRIYILYFLILLWHQVGAQNIDITSSSHAGTIWGYNVSHDKKYTLTFGSDKAIIVWNNNTGKFLKKFNEEPSPTDVKFLQNSNQFATLGKGQLLIRDFLTEKVLQTIPGDFRKLLVNKKKNEIVLVTEDYHIQVYQKKGTKFEMVRSFTQEKEIDALNYSEDERELLYFNQERSLLSIDLSKNTSQTFAIPEGIPSDRIRSFAVSSANVGIGTADGVIYFWNRVNNIVKDSLIYTWTYWAASENKIYKDTASLLSEVSSLHFIDPNTIVASYWEDRSHRLMVWDIQNHKIMLDLYDFAPIVFDYYNDHIVCFGAIRNFIDNTSVPLNSTP